MTINIQLLHYELVQAGLPTISVHENGCVDYSRELNSGEQTTADGIVTAHDPDVMDNLKDAIISTAQSAEGVTLNNLTQGQIKSLFALILWKAGGVAPNGTVKALGEWN